LIEKKRNGSMSAANQFVGGRFNFESGQSLKKKKKKKD
jgi:hypothetical protein